MRRRDGHSYTQAPRLFSQRALLCAGISLALHAGLLLASANLQLPHLQPTEIIRVSLRAGGGHGDVPGRQAGAQAGAAAPAAAAELVTPPQPAHASRKIASVRRHYAPLERAPLEMASASRAALHTDAPQGIGGSSGGGGAAVAENGDGAGSGTGRGVGDGRGDGDDTRAYCQYCPEPIYPLIARRRGWKGTVDVGLVLLADGRVDTATLRRSSGHEVLDREAVDVARRSRFHFPAHAPAAPLYGRIEYRFELLPAP